MGEGGNGGTGEWTAAEWLNSTGEADLAHAFITYADEPKGRRLARTIVGRRQTRPFATSDDLVGAIRAVEKDAEGKLQLFIRGRADVLPVSSAFRHRFRGM